MRQILRPNRLFTLCALAIMSLAALVLIGARSRPFGGGGPATVQAVLESAPSPIRGEYLQKIPEFRRLLRSPVEIGEIDRLATPPGYQIASTGGRIIFAHIADGAIQGTNQFMQTSITVVNDSTYPVAATLQFYENAGGALTLTIDKVSASSFSFSLVPGQMKRLVTSGTGSVKSGWALLRSDQPLAATCSFSLRTTSGGILSDVGVEESIQNTEFTLFADTLGNADTAMALVNPDESNTANVTLELYNSTGVVKASTAVTLQPREHLAKFVTELFRGTSGIGEFEGSLVVQSNRPVTGITLRTLGALLTSVPMVPARNPRDAVTELDFPQIADGTAAPLRIVTSVIVFNNGADPITGTLEFIKADGSPMAVSIGNQTASSFDFNLNPRGVRRFQTQGSGALKTGWARITADAGVAGSAIYQIQNPGAGQVVTEVGVNAAPGTSPINAIADSIADARTGLALANRNPDDSTDVTISLYDGSGAKKAGKEITLEPLAQQALFLDEFFSEVSGIQELLGRVLISGDEGTVALTLRQTGLLTTSVPTVNPVHGFAPVSVFEFMQTLTSTSPAVRWRIEQSGIDLGLNQLSASATGLGANLNFPAGSELGYGVYLLKYGSVISTGGVVKLISTRTDSLTFDVVISGENIEPGTVLMSGKITGQATGNLVIELGPTGASNGDWNYGFGLELDLLLRDGLINAPTQAGTRTIETVYTSASQKLTEDAVRIVRTTTQPQSFTPAAAGSPFLTSSRPLYTSPGGTFVLQGGNFGAEPDVTFKPDGSSDLPAFFPTLVDQGLEVYVPTAAQAGTVQVFNGQSASNQLKTLTIYSPTMTLVKAAGSSGDSFTIDLTSSQSPVQLGLATFQLSLFGAAWPEVQGAAGSVVGSFTITGEAQAGQAEQFDVRLESNQAESISLAVLEEGETDPAGRITLSKGTGTSSDGILLFYAPLTLSDIPRVNGFPTSLELVLDGLVFAPSTAGSEVYWAAESISLPASIFGSETGIRAVQETAPIE